MTLPDAPRHLSTPAPRPAPGLSRPQPPITPPTTPDASQGHTAPPDPLAALLVSYTTHLDGLERQALALLDGIEVLRRQIRAIEKHVQ